MRCCRLVAVLLLAGAVNCALAQPPAAQPTPVQPPKTVAGPVVEASPLDTYSLRDSKGNLVQVLGMTFEEFERLLQLKKGLVGPSAPSYTLDALSLTGAALEGAANLQLTATIRVRQDGWVRVPLLLPSAVLRGEVKHEGPGQHFVAYDADAGGYVCWLQGAGPEPHVITLQASFKLTAVGDETRLALMMPRATESSLRLTVPLASIESNYTGEGLLSTQAVSGQTELSLLGPAGPLQLSWRKGLAPAVKTATQYDVTGDIQVRVESQQSLTSTARLRVRSYSGTVESFQVRLPPGMELDVVPGVSAGYTLTPIAAASSDSAPRRGPVGQIAEVRLDKPAAGVVEVLVAATQQSSVPALARFQPARFDVLGAVRQRGTIDVSVGGQWQLEWTEDPSVRRLDLAPEPMAAGQVARFEYFRQPCGLQLRVTPRPSRVSVEPTHQITVDAQLMRLKTTLKYRFRGARAAGLGFELGDWKLDSLSPSDVLEAAVPGSQPGQIQVPFRAEVAPTELELTLEAHQPLPAPLANIQFTLPRPLADVIAPATVVIAPADNVELTPQLALLIGLTPDAGGVRVPLRQQSALVYRDLGGGEPATFAAAAEVRTRTSIVSGRATVRLDRQQMQVEQRLDYRIAHEPQRDFHLLAPRGLLTAGNLQAWLGEVPRGVTVLPEPPAQGAAANRRLQVTAPTEQIGLCQLAIRYTLPLAAWSGDKPLSLGVPLVVPADEADQQFSDQQLIFQTAEGWQIEPDLTGVDEFSHPAAVPAVASGPAFVWSKATTQSQWIVQPLASNQQSSCIVAKAWFQSWLSPRWRQERAAFRLTTAQESLRLQLPRGASSPQAAINGQQTPQLIVRETGLVRIDLPPALRGRELTLELWYALPAAEVRAGIGTSRWRPATIEGAGPPRRTYWQLALPAGEHLLAGPRELAPEMSWSTGSLFLARRPLLDQRQLEDWIRASRQDPLPRGMRHYLFGTVGRAATLEHWSIDRRLLMALASGGVLALGLSLLYLPALRRPGALLALVVALAGLALAAPDVAVLIAQGATIGFLVVGGVAVWVWLGSGRAPWPVAVPSRSLSRSTDSRPRESQSTHSPLLRAEPVPLTASSPAAGATLEARP